MTDPDFDAKLRAWEAAQERRYMESDAEADELTGDPGELIEPPDDDYDEDHEADRAGDAWERWGE